jgi:threonine aldolase
MRFQSTQLDAYLTDGLWLRLAATANQAMSRLVTGLVERGFEPDHVPQANMVFVRADPAEIDAWAQAGLDFYRLTKDRVRFVTSFRSTPEQIDDALRRIDVGRHVGLADPD